jgi:elongation factor 1-gamma
MRVVGRLGQDRYPVYGTDAYSAARIDSFLDASLVFARDSQIYLLALSSDSVTADIHARAKDSFHTYMAGIERGLQPKRQFLVGDSISLADICFVAEFTLFSVEKAQHVKLAAKGFQGIVHDGIPAEFPSALAHYHTLREHAAFAPDVAPYLEKIQKRIERDAA